MNNLKGLMTSTTDDWATPKQFFADLNQRYQFTLDPCASDMNYKCRKYFTVKEDGLQQEWWGGDRCFVNPPYGRQIGKWVEKAYKTNLEHGNLIVMLLPARTDTKWFHDYIYHKAKIVFIKGRLKFNDGTQPAPFPSMLVIYEERPTGRE